MSTKPTPTRPSPMRAPDDSMLWVAVPASLVLGLVVFAINMTAAALLLVTDAPQPASIISAGIGVVFLASTMVYRPWFVILDEDPRPDDTMAIVDALDHQGGWYEWVHPTKVTTHAAYVHEDGDVYLPEADTTRTDFILATAASRVWRLERTGAPL